MRLSLLGGFSANFPKSHIFDCFWAVFHGQKTKKCQGQRKEHSNLGPLGQSHQALLANHVVFFKSFILLLVHVLVLVPVPIKLSSNSRWVWRKTYWWKSLSERELVEKCLISDHPSRTVDSQPLNGDSPSIKFNQIFPTRSLGGLQALTSARSGNIPLPSPLSPIQSSSSEHQGHKKSKLSGWQNLARKNFPDGERKSFSRHIYAPKVRKSLSRHICVKSAWINRFRDKDAKVLKLFLQSARYGCCNNAANNICLKSFQSVWKFSKRSGKFPDSPETFYTVWNFPYCQENFQTIWKLSRPSGNFPDPLESFQTIWKLSRLL